MKKTWWKESVVYQIYPRSFMDSNGDGIGDIQGIISKLDYLKELGIDVIWISPMLESPQDDFGYDISDYRKIYHEYGTNEDYKLLLDEAHKRGIRILMDLVVNHSSDEHEWFQASLRGEEPYKDFYIWRDPVDGLAPTKWGSNFGGPAWDYKEERGQYYLHLFSKKQPDLNWENPDVRKAVYDMMHYWCQMGVDGFRMDVINGISKDQSFPEGPVANDMGYTRFDHACVNGPRIHEFLQEMNREVLSKYDLLTVGETSGVTPEDAWQFAGNDTNELNMVFHFEHVDLGSGPLGKWTTERFPFDQFREIMNKWQIGLYGKAWNSLYLENHDQPRSVSRFGDDRPQYRETSAKMLATCLHMMQGTPYVYQGEELGMINAYFEDINDYRDIESLNKIREMTEKGVITEEKMMECLKAKGRDNARTPVQWDDSEQAGFTTGTPWIPVIGNQDQINAKDQLAREDSVFKYYQTLIRLRKEMPVIVYGDFTPVEPDHPQVYAFIRSLEDKKLLVVCNFFEEETAFHIPEEFLGSKLLIGNMKQRAEQADFSEGEIILGSYEAFVLEV